MFPILYESITAGVVPQNNGLGVLSDAISCNCEEERNGIYEVTIEYPFSGIHAEQISRLRVIKVKPNFTDNPQLFYIDRLSKVMNGVFTIYCKHISYLLSGIPILTGSANSAVAACSLLQNAATGYTITTDKTASGNFNISEPSSVRSWFGGKAGSLLDVFGTGEWKYDNFNCNLLLHRGSNRGETIRYKKNLLELSQEIDTSNLYTHVLCFWKSEDAMVIGNKLPTGLTLDVEKTMIMDASSDYDEQPTSQQLTTKTQNYIDNNNLTTPTENITLDFVQSGELANRVDLCDTVSIYYEALGITRTQIKCIRTVFDCIREKYIETEFGDPKTNITDTIIATNNEVATKPTVSYLDNAVQKATQLITGNLGGHLIIHDSNGDGEPDELLIMDTDDINTAVNVWRFNQAGWGHSSTGYDGIYTLAATLDGGMVANFITTGSMSANRIRTGLIISNNNQLIIDLDNGTITAPSITLQGEDVGATLDSLVQTSVVTKYALSNSGTVIPSAFPLDAPTTPTDQQPYLWSRTVYTYANGQTSTSYGVSVKGAKGADGADGTGIEILGSYDTMADLIAAHPTGQAGQAYMVGTDLVVWDANTSSWKDVGRIQGPSGFDGLWLAIENDDDGTSSNVTYTVKLLKGVTDVTSTYNAVFVWQLVKESGITEIATGTDTITVARDSADYGATIRCICIAILTEENLEDYSYTVIQDYSGNDIQIIGSNIIKLIGESEIYKPYAISSQFQVLSDEISSKVEQTDFNSLEGTVTSQGTLIQQNADAILLKADTSTVDTQMNGKMATNMSNRASSILIDSGQIRFDSNSLVVNSSKFTLDANGNATFAGNITGASLNIGGEYVGIADAIDDAESSAISAAAIDATNKANNAKDTAINTASTDATTKANNAKNTAISTANAYTDTGLSGKVGNNEIRTKFAADNHSVTIESGTVKFKSNTLLVDSTQFTLDANGNATFKGNLSAATLVIGGSTTNIGTAINNAENDAISTAAADATTKANNAKNSAITAAASDATTKANNAKTSAISTAAADATTKANNAKTSAISTASADATTKANNALNSSKSYTDTGLATKVGNDEVRTKFAADEHSVTIESGTIKFKSNTLLVDSTQFTLDANGNATFKGNLSAATLNIGGTATNIGTAISNAESDAISAAALDATTKANNAKNSAISTASADATTKANNARTSAISAASSDATTKANNALLDANIYTDTGLAGKVGNNEIRTKFAADEHSVTIESGTVKFKSNTLLVDSTQFTLDAQGNAVFKGNLSAATLNIGGTATNIGTAISNAESDAISAAAADATTKANNAKNSAISTAASDATTKANNAKSAAIATAASDATYKANTALTNANIYTDSGLATKVGNNEIRTKFAADNHSVTIESGEIAFRSNTFSVDSNNLNITKYGLVTANNFKAKNTFSLMNSSDVVLATIQAGRNGGIIAAGKTDTTQVATLQATSDGGLLSLANGTGEQTAYIAGATGYIRTTGSIKADGDLSVDGNITTQGNTTVNGNLKTLGEFRCKNVCDMQNESGQYRVLNWLYSDCGIVYVYDYNTEAVIKLSGNTGNITCNAVIQTSSRKLKENIKPIEDSEKILELQAVSFDYKNKDRGIDRRGFVAEDVAEILPNLVTPETEESPASLDYISMIPYLQDIIKKQQADIDYLKAEIEKLKGDK